MCRRGPKPGAFVLSGALAIALGAATLAAAPAGAQDSGGAAGAAQQAACANAGLLAVDAATTRRAKRALGCLIAHERERRGLSALRSSAALGRAAQRHASDMRRRTYFGHVSPSGSALVDRVRRERYALKGSRFRVSETLGFGIGDEGTPQGIVEVLLRSREHRARMLGTSFRHLGVGLSAGLPVRRDGRGTTLTLVFGHR